MTPALEQIKALLDKLPNIAILDAVDDTALTGNRPLPVTLTLAEWRMLRTALQALSDEAGEAVVPLGRGITRDPERIASHIEFLAAGIVQIVGDTEVVSQAVRAIRAGGSGYRPAPAAEAAPQGGDAELLAKESCLLVNGKPRFRTVQDGATLQDYLNSLVVGMLTPVDQMGLDNLLHDALAAIPPSAPAVRTVRAIPSLAYHDTGRVSMSEADFERLRIAAAEGENAIRRLSAPVPQEGVDEAMEERALRAFWQAYGDQQRIGGGRQAGRTAAGIRAVLALAAGALPQGMVLVPREVLDRFPEINPSNYDHDGVCALNAWAVELVLAAAPAQGVR